ncbi:ribonuclease H-like domain-containing protein [Tanacetum coccineum]
MALPNEHQLIFSQYPDAKSMFAALNTSLEVGKIRNGSNCPTSGLMSKFYEEDLDKHMVLEVVGSTLLLMCESKESTIQRTKGKERRFFINGNDIAGYDKSKVECYNCHKLGHFAREYRAPRSKEVEPKKVRKNNDAPIIEDWVSDDEEQDESKTKPEKKTVIPTAAKIEKPVKKSVRYAEMYRSQSPRGNQRNWNGQKSNQLGSEFVMYNKACFICGSFNHVQKNCTYHPKKKVISGNNYTRGKPQLDDKGFVDSGCSRHMTGTVSNDSVGRTFCNQLQQVGLLVDSIIGKKATIRTKWGLHKQERFRIWGMCLGIKQEARLDQALFIKASKKEIFLLVQSASTPVDLEKPLVKDGDADDVDVHLYRSMIGSLMYLTASRPLFIVCKATLEKKSTTGGLSVFWGYQVDIFG